jgi:hypothetical protein
MDKRKHIIMWMQRYASQINTSAQAGQKPGAALANYMRTLRMLDELETPDAR